MSISSSWLGLQRSRMLSAMGGGRDSEPLQGLASGLPPPSQKELAQALDVATRFDVHIAQVGGSAPFVVTHALHLCILIPLLRFLHHFCHLAPIHVQHLHLSTLQAMSSNVYAHLQQCGAIVTVPALALDAADTPACAFPCTCR